MSRFVRLDTGVELTGGPIELGAAALTVRLKLLDASPPFRSWDIVHVKPLAGGERRPHGLLLCGEDGAFSLRSSRDGPVPGRILGRVVGVERGQTVVPLGGALLSRLSGRLLARAIDAGEILGRLRHPLSPPLFLGDVEASLASVRAKYGRAPEVRDYARLAATGLDPLERAIVEGHVRPGGRLLDIGCGAGREALGFTRAGFEVVGIDIAPAMIEAARRNAEREGLEIEFKAQSVTDLAGPGEAFDGAYWAGSYHHVPGRALRLEALRRVGRMLTRDGVLVLVVVYRAERGLVSRSRLVDFLRRAGRGLLAAARLSEPGDGYMREVSEASDPTAPCYFRDFARPDEVRVEIEAAGFTAEEVARGFWVCRKKGSTNRSALDRVDRFT